MRSNMEHVYQSSIFRVSEVWLEGGMRAEACYIVFRGTCHHNNDLTKRIRKERKKKYCKGIMEEKKEGEEDIPDQELRGQYNRQARPIKTINQYDKREEKKN